MSPQGAMSGVAVLVYLLMLFPSLWCLFTSDRLNRLIIGLIGVLVSFVVFMFLIAFALSLPSNGE